MYFYVLGMYQASDNSSHVSEIFGIVDFVGYVLFFVAIFYVAHAVYIMCISALTSSYYEKMHALSTAEVLQEYSALERTAWGQLARCLSMFSLSWSQRKVEFKIIYVLFRDTYWLPSDFDYGAYLSGCLARYSRRIIDIGVYSWLVMVFLALLNLLRVLLLGGEIFGCNGLDSDTDEDETNGECERQHTYLFLVCGLLLCIYSTILLWMGQIYSRRFDSCAEGVRGGIVVCV